MFPIRLTHPLHGATHAHDTHELDRLKKAGWQLEPAIQYVAPSEVLVTVKPKRAYNRKAA